MWRRIFPQRGNYLWHLLLKQICIQGPGKAWKWWTFPMQTIICTQYHHVKGKKHLENILMSLATPNYIQKRWSIGWCLACQVRYGLAPQVNLIGEGMSLTCAANTFSNCSNSNTCLLFQEHRVGHWSKWLIRTDNEPGQQKTKWWTNPKGICRTSFKRSRSDQISDLHKYWDVLYFYGCNVHKSWIYWSSGQIIIFHQPRFPCFPAILNGIPHVTLPFGLRSFLGALISNTYFRSDNHISWWHLVGPESTFAFSRSLSFPFLRWRRFFWGDFRVPAAPGPFGK